MARTVPPPLSFGRPPIRHDRQDWWKPEISIVRTNLRRLHRAHSVLYSPFDLFLQAVARSPRVDLETLLREFEAYSVGPMPTPAQLRDVPHWATAEAWAALAEMMMSEQGPELAVRIWYPRPDGSWVGVMYRCPDAAVHGYCTSRGEVVWHDRPRLPGEPGGHPLPTTQANGVS